MIPLNMGSQRVKDRIEEVVELFSTKRNRSGMIQVRKGQFYKLDWASETVLQKGTTY